MVEKFYNKCMAPFLIGIGGAHSGAGKTTAAEVLLRHLKGWGALKCTPTLLYTALTDGRSALAQKDKDTARMLEAGAQEVLWVQATEEDMAETLRMSVERLSHLEGVVVEGNSAIELLKPDIVIYMAGEPGRGKESARAVLRVSDIVVHAGAPPEETPSGCALFHRDDRDGLLAHIDEVFHERRTERHA
jgi:molybdopterin-guanine dinucleotide biosynthesis protein